MTGTLLQLGTGEVYDCVILLSFRFLAAVIEGGASQYISTDPHKVSDS